MFRHGDVILQRVSSVPPDAVRRPSAVLARGEATGHSHRIADGSTAVVYEGAGVGFLDVLADEALLVHDEHKPIALPRGTYRFWKQREYTPAEIRTIID
jgi:hypothetical protein